MDEVVEWMWCMGGADGSASLTGGGGGEAFECNMCCMGGADGSASLTGGG